MRKLITKNIAAFSLIELLVVVAVIGILTAIAFPQYKKYLSRSKFNACVTNTDSAIRLVTSELAKKTGSDTSSEDILVPLNRGGKTNPYNPFLPAYDLVDSVTVDPVTGVVSSCTVGITPVNLMGTLNNSIL